MPNIKSAKKRILVNQKKALQNQMVKSQLKTIIKKFNAAVEAGDKAVATDLYRLACKKTDQAVAAGILVGYVPRCLRGQTAVWLAIPLR